jgi:hypothetical protein
MVGCFVPTDLAKQKQKNTWGSHGAPTNLDTTHCCHMTLSVLPQERACFLDLNLSSSMCALLKISTGCAPTFKLIKDALMKQTVRCKERLHDWEWVTDLAASTPVSPRSACNQSLDTTPILEEKSKMEEGLRSYCPSCVLLYYHASLLHIFRQSSMEGVCVRWKQQVKVELHVVFYF